LGKIISDPSDGRRAKTEGEETTRIKLKTKLEEGHENAKKLGTEGDLEQ